MLEGEVAQDRSEAVSSLRIGATVSASYPPVQAQSWHITGNGVQCKEHLTRSPADLESNPYFHMSLCKSHCFSEPICPSSTDTGTNDSTAPFQEPALYPVVLMQLDRWPAVKVGG